MLAVHIKQLKGADEIISQSNFIRDKIRPYISFENDTNSIEFHVPIKVHPNDDGNLPDFSQLEPADFVNKKYVDEQISNIKNGASAQYDTLKEIEDAVKLLLTSGTGGANGSGQMVLAGVESSHADGLPIGNISIGENEYIFKVDLQQLLSNTTDVLRFSRMPYIVNAETLPAGDESNNHIATTAFVHTIINNLKDGVRAELNTLDRIAYAINNDPEFSKHVTEKIDNAVNQKLDINDITITVPESDIAGATVIGNIFLNGNDYEFKIDLAPFAPVNSPVFTGTPVVPDIDNVTEDTSQAVNASFVQRVTDKKISDAVTDIKGDNPVLDNLKKISVALNNDISYASHVADSLHDINSSIGSIANSVANLNSSAGNAELGAGLRSIDSLTVEKDMILYTTNRNEYDSTPLTETGRNLLIHNSVNDIRDFLDVPQKDGSNAFGDWDIRAKSAVKATNDALGQEISTTYAKKSDIPNIKVTVSDSATTANIGLIQIDNELYPLNVDLEPYAPVQDPHFEGEPTAPTPDINDRSTKIATTKFVGNVVDEKVAELVDGAPDALNTLNELATAMGRDSVFSTTVLNRIADKQNKSDALTSLTETANLSNKIVYTDGTGEYKNANISSFVRNSLLGANSATDVRNVINAAAKGEGGTGNTGSTGNSIADNVSLQVSLSSDQPQAFDGSESATVIGVQGILPVAHGGTGSDNLNDITVGSAVKDGNGSVISSTYAKLTGDTFSGDIKMYSPASFQIIEGSAVYTAAHANNILTYKFGYVGVEDYSAGMQILNDPGTDIGHDIVFFGGNRMLLYSGTRINELYGNTASAAHSIPATGADNSLYLLSDNQITFKSNLSDFANAHTMTFNNGILTAPVIKGNLQDSKGNSVEDTYLTKEEAQTAFATKNTVTTTDPGLMPPLEGVPSKFLNSSGQWVTITGSGSSGGTGSGTSVLYSEGQGISIQDNIVSIKSATENELGGIRLGNGITVDAANRISIPLASNVENGLMSTADVEKLASMTEGAEPNVIKAVAINNVIKNPDSNGTVNISVPDISNKADKSDLDDYVKSVSGMGLSSNDFTDDEKEKLRNIGPGATRNTAGTGIDITDGIINVKQGSKSQKGILQVGSNLEENNGVISLSGDNVTAALGYTPVNSSNIPVVMQGASSSKNGQAGLVPAPKKGEQDLFLRADGSWAAPENTGTGQSSSGTGTEYKAGEGLTLNTSTNTFHVNTASEDETGGIKLGNQVTVDNSGTISVKAATTSNPGLMTAAQVTKLNNVENSITGYQIPAATTAKIGGVIAGNGIAIATDGRISLETAGNEIGGIKLGNQVTVDASNRISIKAASANNNGLLTSALFTKLSNVDINAQPNVIETVKLNGTSITPDSSKAINIDISGKADSSILSNYVQKSGTKVLSDKNFTAAYENSLKAVAGATKNSAGKNVSIGSAGDINVATGSMSVPGVLQVGSNISVDSVGVISLTKINVTSALGYTPANKTDTADNFQGATSSANGQAGFVPAPLKAQRTYFLKGDGTWAIPANTDTKYTVDSNTGLSINNTVISGKVATNSDYGMIKVPAVTTSNLSLTADGILSVPLATSVQPGVIKLAEGKQANLTRFLRGDGTWTVPANATSTEPGLMSAADKKILDSVNNNYVIKSNALSNVSANGTALTFTKANGDTVKITTADTNDKVAQNKVTLNSGYPILLAAVASATANIAASNVNFAQGILINPKTSMISGASLNGNADTATKLATARTLKVSLNYTNTGSFDGSANVATIGVGGTLQPAQGGTGTTVNPSMLINLGSTSAANIFAASPRPGVTGTLQPAQGGTGQTNLDNVTVGTAKKSNALTNTVYINGTSFNGIENIILTGICKTAAATAEKAVTINGVATPVADALFAITFNVINTAENPKLNINGDSRFLYKDGKKLTVDNKAFTNTTYQTVLIKALTLPAAKDGFIKNENAWAIVENNVSLSSDLIQGVLPVGKGGTGSTNLDSVTVGAAKKDGAGSVIASTYAKLAGAAFSGSITAPAVSVNSNMITSSLKANSISSFTASDDIILAKKSSIEGINIKAQLGSYFGIKGSSTFDGIKILGAYYKTMNSVSGNATVSVESDTVQSSYGHDVLVQGGQKLILMGGDNAINAYSSHTYGKPVDHAGQAAYMLNEGTDEGLYLLSDHDIIVRSDMNTLSKFKEYKFSGGTVTAPNFYGTNVSVSGTAYGTTGRFSGDVFANRLRMGSYFYTELLENVTNGIADGQESMIYAGNNLFLVAGEGARTAVRNAGNLLSSEIQASIAANPYASLWAGKTISSTMPASLQASLLADILTSSKGKDSSGNATIGYKYNTWQSAKLVDQPSIKSVLHPDFRWNYSYREDINIVADDAVFIYTSGCNYPSSIATGAQDETLIRTASFNGKTFGAIDGSFSGNITATGNITAHNFVVSDVPADKDSLSGSLTSVFQVRMATNDFFRIAVGGWGNNGYAELATADDGTEPIYVRQYKSNFGSVVGAEAVLLDGSHNSKFPGTVSVGAVTATNLSTFNKGINASNKSTIVGGSLTSATIDSPKITSTATIDTISATKATINTVSATNATITTLTATNATVKTGASLASATISSAQIPKVTVSTEASITTATIGSKLNLTGQASVSGTVTLSGTVNINNKVNLGTSSTPQTLVMYENCLVGNTLANTVNGSQTFQGLKILKPNSTAKEGNDVVLNAGQNLILSTGEYPITGYVQGVNASSIPSFMEAVAGTGETIYLATDNQIVFALNCGGSAPQTAKFKNTGVLVLPAGIEGKILTTTAGTVAGSMWLI